MSRRPASPRSPSGDRLGTVTLGPLGRADADLPGRIHASRRDPFGLRAPRLGKALAALSALWGETIVPCGGAAANRLGLITQNPVRAVYLTSGPNRRLHFGSSVVELRHAPRWQLAAPHRKAGDVIRALAWLGPEEVEDGLKAVLPTLRDEDRAELSAARATMPNWMAQPVSARLSHG